MIRRERDIRTSDLKPEGTSSRENGGRDKPGLDSTKDLAALTWNGEERAAERTTAGTSPALTQSDPWRLKPGTEGTRSKENGGRDKPGLDPTKDLAAQTQRTGTAAERTAAGTSPALTQPDPWRLKPGMAEEGYRNTGRCRSRCLVLTCLLLACLQPVTDKACNQLNPAGVEIVHQHDG